MSHSPPLQSVWLHGLTGSKNAAADVRQILGKRKLLRPGMRLDGPGTEFIVGTCMPPPGGRYDEGSTEVMFGDKALKVFQKVHVLPYQDTFKYNYDHMYREHMVPYFHTRQAGEFTEGYDFSHQGVRFQVVGVQPDKSYGVVGKDTEIFYEGPAIERKVLEKLHVLPMRDGLPERYMATKLSLDAEALMNDYVRPYFDMRSQPVKTGDSMDIEGVTFKVMSCKPAAGGGVGPDTELSCSGVALKPAASGPAAKSSAISKALAKAKAKGRGKGGGGADAATDSGNGNCVLS